MPRKTLLSLSFQPWLRDLLLCTERLPERPRPPGSRPKSEITDSRFSRQSIFHFHQCTRVSVTTLYLVFKYNKNNNGGRCKLSALFITQWKLSNKRQHSKPQSPIPAFSGKQATDFQRVSEIKTDFHFLKANSLLILLK